MMGAPIIVKKDKKGFALLRRDTLENVKVSKNLLVKEIQKILTLIQNKLHKKAKEFNKDYTKKVSSWMGFEDIALNKGGFIEAVWCGNPECAKGIREIKKYSVRVVNPLKTLSKCIHCNKRAQYAAIFAPAY